MIQGLGGSWTFVTESPTHPTPVGVRCAKKTDDLGDLTLLKETTWEKRSQRVFARDAGCTSFSWAGRAFLMAASFAWGCEGVVAKVEAYMRSELEREGALISLTYVIVES
ncbi:MAG: hypothetical protein RJA70_4369 [Pseudomonadota bacterium]